MKLPQFTLRQVIVSTALIAAGLYGQIWALDVFFYHPVSLSGGGGWNEMMIWLASGALIGAGAFNLFNRPILGAAIGFGCQFAVLAGLVFYNVTRHLG